MPGAGLAFREINTDNFGNDFASFFYKNRIALMQVEPGYLVGIVQSRPLNCSPGEKYRFKMCNGCYRPGTTHIITDIFECSFHFLGLVFIGNCPTG